MDKPSLCQPSLENWNLPAFLLICMFSVMVKPCCWFFHPWGCHHECLCYWMFMLLLESGLGMKWGKKWPSLNKKWAFLVVQLLKSQSDIQETACKCGLPFRIHPPFTRPGLDPGSERSPGERNGNPLQYSCLGNLMDRGAWLAIVHGVTKSWTRLSN